MTDTGIPQVSIGDVISSKFRVERVLGSGGNGVVVLATHLHLDERVALKFLMGAEAGRVAEGARATVKLKSDHIARVLDTGRHGDAPYIVMEYLEGQDLEALVVQSGRIEDVAEAVEIVLQACEAIAEAHRLGLMHRDIKLANLFLVASRTGLPRVKLLDFGVPRVGTGETGAAAFGSPHYIAPERLLGIDDDPRSDLWSLGVVLFELLSGEKPFRSANSVRLIAEVLDEHHAELLSLREGLPPKLNAVIERCLTKDPELRYQSAGELASALAPFAPVRAQVHVERALEFTRTAPPIPSSSPSMEGARKALAESSRSLRTSRSETSTSSSPTSTRPLTATGTGRAKRRSIAVAVWGIATVAVIVLVSLLMRSRSASTSAATRAKAPDAPASPAWTEVEPDDPNVPGATSAAAAPGASAGTRAASRVPAGGRAPAPWGRAPAASTAPGGTRATADVATATATANPAPSQAPANGKPGLEADPWKASKTGTGKPKLDAWQTQ